MCHGGFKGWFLSLKADVSIARGTLPQRSRKNAEPSGSRKPRIPGAGCNRNLDPQAPLSSRLKVQGADHLPQRGPVNLSRNLGVVKSFHLFLIKMQIICFQAQPCPLPPMYTYRNIVWDEQWPSPSFHFLGKPGFIGNCALSWEARGGYPKENQVLSPKSI